MPTRFFETNLQFEFLTIYKRTDEGVDTPINVQDRIQTNLVDNLLDGFGTGKGNVLKSLTITTTTAINIISALTDIYEDNVSITALKGFIIENQGTDENHLARYTYKNEAGQLGPGGFAILWEDSIEGIEASESETSESDTFGIVTLTLTENFNVALIFVGSQEESSSEASSSEG